MAREVAGLDGAARLGEQLTARADEAMYQAKRQRTGPLGLVVSRSQAAA